jgi:ligand-binding SRPBCC domain-containing protein
VVRIELSTRIVAPVERCFDLARSVDAHLASTHQTGEQAISGVMSGLIGMGEEVTWRARFFGIPVTHTSRISVFQYPHYFQDTMIRGAFRGFCHNHYFETNGEATIMRDSIVFSAPYGWLGRAVELLILRRHLLNLIERRNAFLRETAESEAWKKYLR